MRDPHQLYWHDHVLKYTFLPLIPRWVKPNHVTIFRFVATPFVFMLLLFGEYQIGVPVFFAVAFTDALDGSLARVRKQITQWGTMFDPVADKILISSIVILIVMQHINFWFGLIIVLIELFILIVGYIRTLKGGHVQANIWGKLKMFLQVCGVLFLLLALWMGIDLFVPISTATFALGIVVAMISIFTYSL
ncbi:MAG: hypothetical protein ACD_76C00015G0007 [uncultured bacterium]|nr:MAG: hypothetical protein ACD_76C00015G0007 [uncultured bacterium]HBD05062.1 hypothetical protein [Candidatus Uhrbacteria bacterium]